MSNQGLFGFPTGDTGKNDAITYQDFARNFGLSPSDMGKVVNVNTHNGYNLILPDCRQITGQRFIIIKNNSATNLFVTNNGGVSIIKIVAPNSSVVLACTDISSANGVWSALAGTNLTTLYVGSPTTVNNISSNTFSITALSETTAIATYRDATNTYVYAVVLTISGTTITVGTPVQVSYHASSVISPKVCAISSTTAVVVCVPGGSSVSANILTVSGSTISVGGTATIAASANFISICLLNSTTAIVCRGDVSCVLTISGTTCSFNTGYSLISTAGAPHSICALDSTHAVVFYSNGTDRYAGVLTVSGTVISIGSVYLVVSGSDAVSICALDSTHAVAFYRAVGGYASAITLTIAGSIVSVGAVTVIESAVSDYRSITALNKTTALVFYQSTSSYAASNILTINPSTGAITAGNQTIVYSAAAGTNESVCTLPNTTSFVAFYKGLSSYAYANVLSYTQ
jgi:hypothetical protein